MSDYFYEDFVDPYYGDQQESCAEPFQNSVSMFGDNQDVSDGDYTDDFYGESNYMRGLQLLSAH